MAFQSYYYRRAVIKNALNDLDNKKRNNKVVFDESIGEDDIPQKKTKSVLFDDDDNDSDSNWNENEFQINTKKKKTKVTLGNDARFTLDDRFLDENEDAQQEPEFDDATNVEKEKEWQLDILETVLGAPVATKNKESKPILKGKMIRYDPTQNEHKEYEVTPQNVEPSKKEKKKKKKQMEATAEESAPVPVSKDIYYKVSDTLVESLKQKGEFSLLKTHGREESVMGKESDNKPDVSSTSQPKFRFQFDTKNPFKYDSSDEEDTDQKQPEISNDVEEQEPTNNFFGTKDNFFFEPDDIRFNEGIKFFENGSVSTDEFKNLRRELKQIVRSKIRKNVRRHQPWGKKRKVKK